MHADFRGFDRGVEFGFIARSNPQGERDLFWHNDEFLSGLRHAYVSYPFRNVLVLELSDSGYGDQECGIISTDFPKDFLNRYRSLSNQDRDYFRSRCEVSSVPFGWDLAELPSAEAMQAQPDAGQPDANLVLLLQERGLSGGYCIPVRCPFGQSACVVLFSDYPQSGIQYPDLIIPIVETVEKLVLEMHRQMIAGYQLTDRERQCLKWVADGKTSNEVAKIVGLSEHTVNHYLISATRKLDSVNRVQAVAKFIRSGISENLD